MKWWLCLAAFIATLAPVSANAAGFVGAVAMNNQRNQTVGGINYNGGPVMSGRVHVYVIWYGASFPAWSQTQSLVDYFIANWGASHSYGVLRSYYDANGNRIAPELALSGEIFDSGSIGDNLEYSDVQWLINQAILNGEFPADSNGIYLLLEGQGVNVTDKYGATTCAQSCGFHDAVSLDSTDIKYGVVAGNCNGCGVPHSPNNDVFADSMISIMAHEIAETVTDPDDNAWGAPGNNEVGDKCAWNFSEQHNAPNGIPATAQVGSNYYFIQKLWTPTNGGGCYSGYSPPAAIIWQNGPGGQIAAWKMKDESTVAAYINYPSIPTGQNVLATGDFVNGINPQILTIDSSNNGPVTMWTLHSDGTASSAPFFSSFDATTWNVAGVGDYDGDGRTDLLFRNVYTGDVYLELINGGTIEFAQDIGSYSPWQALATGDFNGDGLADIFWFDQPDRQYGVWNTAGVPASGSNFQFDIPNPINENRTPIGVADLNGDGMADVILNPDSGGQLFADTLTFSGGSVTNTDYIPTSLYSPAWQGTVDANRDGVADIYAQTPNGLEITVMASWKTLSNLQRRIVGDHTGAGLSDWGWEVVGTGGFLE